MSRYALVLTSEHGGNQVPRELRGEFSSAKARKLLASHRGWDPGSLPVAKRMARKFDAPLVSTTISRLVVDANRSRHHARIISELLAHLDRDSRQALIDQYWQPYRDRVDDAIGAALTRRQPVLHISVHSFTPRMHGEVRPCDIGLLYDPRRPSERALCARWKPLLQAADPGLRIRRNYPYLGKNDGLVTTLRRRLPDRKYVGIELELNQGGMAVPKMARRMVDAVLVSLERLLAE